MQTTEAKLRKHADRYGKDGLAEVAERMPGGGLLAVPFSEAGSRGPCTSQTMMDHVPALHERGLVPGAMADVLNLSDSREATLLRQIRSESKAR